MLWGDEEECCGEMEGGDGMLRGDGGKRWIGGVVGDEVLYEYGE